MSNELMKFRLSYLRFISKCWGDENYFSYIKDKYNLYENVIDLKMALEKIGYKCPWKNIDVHLNINPDNGKYDPDGAGGWVGMNDTFIINIPVWNDNDTIENVNETQKVAALSAYYYLFPTIFGNNQENDSSMEKDLNFDLSEHIGFSSDSDVVGVSGGEDGSNFLNFSSIILQTMGLAWEDENFRNELFENRDIDKSNVLSKYFNFRNPWNFNLIFYKNEIKINTSNMDERGFYWTMAKPFGNKEMGSLGKWDVAKIPHNVIQLNYPNKPDIKYSWPLALNAYNSTGPAYPFTCP